MARRQLVAAGLTRGAIERRLASGRLVPLHRGVYAVGHGHLRREGHWLAAVLAVPGSVLSHRDAAGLHGLRPANHQRIDVTTVDARGEHRGIRIHRTRVLDATDFTVVRGVPVTTVARTLVDLASAVPKDQLARALHEAERQRLLDVHAVEATRAHTRTRRGRGDRALREALAELAEGGVTLTRSSLEDAFLTLLSGAGLPKPRTNVHIEGMEVDAYWPDRQLVVELDGYASHHSRRAFQRDRTKGNALTQAGYKVLRYTHADVVRRPRAVAGELRAALASSPPRATMSGACR